VMQSPVALLRKGISRFCPHRIAFSQIFEEISPKIYEKTLAFSV